MPDVRMPDGTIIRGVPEGMTRSQLVQKIAASKMPGIFDNAPIIGPAIRALRAGIQPGSASDMFTHDYTMGADVPAAGLVNKILHPLTPGAFQQGMQQRRGEITAARARNPVTSGLSEAAGAITSVPGQIAQKAALAAKASPILSGLAAKIPALVPSTIDAGLWGSGVGASEGQDPLKSAAYAAGGNVAGAGVARGLSRALSPVLSRPAAALAAQGVELTPYQEAVRTLNSVGTRMTPGQIGGGNARTVEDALATVPVIGSMQRAGQRRALESFNLGAINDAISPVGQLPKGVRAGRDAIGTAQKIVSKAYDKSLSGVVMPLDEVFHAQLNDAISNATQNLSPDQISSFSNDLAKYVRPFVGSEMAGKDIQSIKQGLDGRIAKYVNSSTPADEHVADALGAVKNVFMGNFQRHAPDAFAGFQAADQAYRNLAPINIAGAANKTDGVIAPLQFSSATARRGYGNTTNKIARGDATGQDIANAASIVLPAKLPSSGTAERAGILALLGGSGAAAHFFTPAALPAAALSIPYIPAVDRAYQAARLAPRGLVLDALANRLQLAAPAAGMALAPTALQFSGQ